MSSEIRRGSSCKNDFPLPLSFFEGATFVLLSLFGTWQDRGILARPLDIGIEKEKILFPFTLLGSPASTL